MLQTGDQVLHEQCTPPAEVMSDAWSANSTARGTVRGVLTLLLWRQQQASYADLSAVPALHMAAGVWQGPGFALLAVATAYVLRIDLNVLHAEGHCPMQDAGSQPRAICACTPTSSGALACWVLQHCPALHLCPHRWTTFHIMTAVNVPSACAAAVALLDFVPHSNRSIACSLAAFNSPLVSSSCSASFPALTCWYPGHDRQHSEQRAIILCMCWMRGAPPVACCAVGPQSSSL